MFFWDPTFVLIIPAALFAFWAQFRVRSAFNQWSRKTTLAGRSGLEVARDILDRSGLEDVRIERAPGLGDLTDHYDPTERVLRLSPQVYDGRSVAALGVAAHEVGHAIQHDLGYAPLYLRSRFVPLANLGSQGGPLLFFVGLIFGNQTGLFLMDLGIWFFSAAVAFYMITLPVEFNASARALAVLERGGYLTEYELPGARKVLNAAALTYVAAATMAVLELVRLFVLRGMIGRRED